MNIPQWLSAVVKIPSVTPTQAGRRSGTAGEAQIAVNLAKWFSQFGGEVLVQDILPNRPSVYGVWRGKSGRWLAIDVHTDTVGVEQMTADPFDGRIENGRVYGRGAVDTKATLGVVLALLEEIRAAGRTLSDNLLIAATADEEVTARGAPALAAWLAERSMKIDELLVAEPTMCAPVHGHKGVLSMDFHIRGKSAHASQPHLGENALCAGVQLAVAMEGEHRRLQTAPPTPLGVAVLSVTRMHAGVGSNVIPDACDVTVNRRILPTERAAQVKRQLHELAIAASPLPLSIQVPQEIDAFYRSPDSPLVRKLAEWSGQVPAIAPFCTNAWAYNDVAEQCVVIGPGSIEQAHGEVEWVEISQLEKLAAILSRWWGIL